MTWVSSSDFEGNKLVKDASLKLINLLMKYSGLEKTAGSQKWCGANNIVDYMNVKLFFAMYAAKCISICLLRPPGLVKGPAKTAC